MSFSPETTFLIASAARFDRMPFITVNPSDALADDSTVSSSALSRSSVSSAVSPKASPYFFSCASVLAICASWLLIAILTLSAAAEFSPYSATVAASSFFCRSRILRWPSSVVFNCLSFAWSPSADELQSSIPAVAALNSEDARRTARLAACISFFSCDMSARNLVVLCVSAIFLSFKTSHPPRVV